jgi:hypothetical protein
MRLRPVSFVLLLGLSGCSNDGASLTTPSVAGGTVGVGETRSSEARPWQPYPSYRPSAEGLRLIREALKEAALAPPNSTADVYRALDDLRDVEPAVSAVWGPIDGPVQYYVDIRGRSMTTRWIVDLDLESGICEFDGVLEFVA